jgi:putative sterol carrier protein
MGVASVSEFFEDLVPRRFEKDPAEALSIGAIYKFDVTGDDGGSWVLDLTKPEVRTGDGEGDAQCTVTVSAEDFLGILNNTLNPVQAFMTGKIQVAGDMSLAMKLQQVLATDT